VRRALTVLALIAAVLTAGAPAASASTAASGHPGYRYPYTCPAGSGHVSADRAWVSHVVGCATSVDNATVRRIIELRDLGVEGIAAGVPAREIVAHFAEVLGNRMDAVTLWTATSIYARIGR